MRHWNVSWTRMPLLFFVREKLHPGVKQVTVNRMHKSAQSDELVDSWCAAIFVRATVILPMTFLNLRTFSIGGHSLAWQHGNSEHMMTKARAKVATASPTTPMWLATTASVIKTQCLSILNLKKLEREALVLSVLRSGKYTEEKLNSEGESLIKSSVRLSLRGLPYKWWFFMLTLPPQTESILEFGEAFAAEGTRCCLRSWRKKTLRTAFFRGYADGYWAVVIQKTIPST